MQLKLPPQIKAFVPESPKQIILPVVAGLGASVISGFIGAAAGRSQVKRNMQKQYKNIIDDIVNDQSSVKTKADVSVLQGKVQLISKLISQSQLSTSAKRRLNDQLKEVKANLKPLIQ